MNIEIVNIYKAKPDFYCGRGSALGNPFRLEDTNDNAQRDHVCDQYEAYFIDQVVVKRNQSMLRQLAKIKQKLVKDGTVKLGCFCAPKRCHCETIKEYVLKDLKDNKEIKGLENAGD